MYHVSYEKTPGGGVFLEADKLRDIERLTEFDPASFPTKYHSKHPKKGQEIDYGPSWTGGDVQEFFSASEKKAEEPEKKDEEKHEKKDE